MASTGYHRSDNAEVYSKNASFVYSSANTAAVLRLLDAQRGDKILDLGCGTLRFRLSFELATRADLLCALSCQQGMAR